MTEYFEINPEPATPPVTVLWNQIWVYVQSKVTDGVLASPWVWGLLWLFLAWGTLYLFLHPPYQAQGRRPQRVKDPDSACKWHVR